MKTPALEQKHYLLLTIALLIAYLLGLWVPLMDEDPSHHGDIALQMHLSNNYIELLSKGRDYLDKPHMLFWISAAFFKLLGVTTLAYKLPSFLISCLGIYSTYRLGKRLYSIETGLLAALITASAQAQILANNDVRMDAMLTGFITFATWQLTEAVYTNKWRHYLLGALGMALAFSTKGMIGIAMPAAAIFFLLAYQRNWKRLINLRWIYVAILSGILITPVLYCFYIQFDLHPEKVIRGRSDISGVEFILWGQSIERFEGSNFGKGESKPLFFLHTMLWAFTPWVIITYYAIISQAAFLFKTRFSYQKGTEFLTLGTIIFILIVLSSARYQLPHYLNILFPFLGIITAQKLLALHHSENGQTALGTILKVQYLVAAFCVIVAILLNTWIFPVKSPLVIITSILVLGILMRQVFKAEKPLTKAVIVSTLSIAFANILQNGNFYPYLIQYQAGPALAKVIKNQKINPDKVYKFNSNSYSFDFYAAKIIPFISEEELKNKAVQGEEFWLFTDEHGKNKVQSSGLTAQLVSSHPNYRITRLKAKFLNPKTRDEACYNHYLIKIDNRTATK